MAAAIDEGGKLPDIELSTPSGGKLNLRDYLGKPFILYFYPKDDTPGCTTEGKAFSEARAAFDALNAVVVGVSKDTVKSHGKFRLKHGLDVRLGSDVEGRTIEDYGVWVEKSMYGRSYMGIERATFLIDGAGVVRRVWRKVSVKGHVDEVLAAARALKGE